jgi:hypothetical protein
MVRGRVKAGRVGVLVCFANLLRAIEAFFVFRQREQLPQDFLVLLVELLFVHLSSLFL